MLKTKTVNLQEGRAWFTVNIDAKARDWLDSAEGKNYRITHLEESTMQPRATLRIRFF